MKAPTIGEVEGIEMRVLMSWEKTAPLSIELIAENIEYLRAVALWQIKDGGIKRRSLKRQHDDVESHNDGGLVEHSDDREESPPRMATPQKNASGHRVEEMSAAKHERFNGSRITDFFAKPVEG